MRLRIRRWYIDDDIIKRLVHSRCHILFRRVLGNETIEENVSDNAMVLVHRRMSELRNKVNQIRERQARVENKTVKPRHYHYYY